MEKGKSAIFLALLAAALFGLNVPVARLLLVDLSPALLAALLYLGAGVGMLAVSGAGKLRHQRSCEAGLSRQDLPYAAAMVVLDIAAPICLMTALTLTSPASASLLGNFEIVATACIALLFFHEAIGRRMWLAIALITAASMILSLEDGSGLSLSPGSLLVLAACAGWGLENNCTRRLSLKDPMQIVMIKGFGSGTGSLLVALALGTFRLNVPAILGAMLLGFASYGLSIYCYIRAQRDLGAARTSAYYAAAPFFGTLLSMAIFRQGVTAAFASALAVMTAGAWLAASERHRHFHVHEAVTHDHRHSHDDLHHDHVHDPPVSGEHSHPHTHEAVGHVHPHMPDLHHTHNHNGPEGQKPPG